jgi:hypothetical protein
MYSYDMIILSIMNFRSMFGMGLGTTLNSKKYIEYHTRDIGHSITNTYMCDTW